MGDRRLFGDDKFAENARSKGERLIEVKSENDFRCETKAFGVQLRRELD